MLWLVACIQCECGLTSKSALSHARITHEIPLSREERTTIQDILDKPSILKNPGDAEPPKNPCAPIDGLLQQKGLICPLCPYAGTAESTIRNHLRNVHRDAKGPAKSKKKVAIVQSFSKQNPKYFKVIPILSQMSKGNLFSVYLDQHAPEIDSLQLVNPPVDHHEVPPLLKITLWHEHLAPYIGDETKILSLLELTKTPPVKEEIWIGTPLRKTIEAYMKDAAHKGNHCPLRIRCLLMECPRNTQNSDHWVPLPDATIETYALFFHQWTHAVMLTIDGHESGYTFPLTEEDKRNALELKKALIAQPKKLHIDLFHVFIKPLVYPMDHSLIPGPYSKFNEPFECFYALSCLREDGNFQPPNLVTQKFARMKYFTRGTVLYQGLKVSDGDHYA